MAYCTRKVLFVDAVDIDGTVKINGLQEWLEQ
jgi:hypothetical protein